MGILNRIQSVFDAPVNVVLRPMNGGVELYFEDKQKRIAYGQLKNGDRLPQILHRAIQRSTNRIDESYLIPFETGRELAAQLQSQLDRAFRLDADPVLKLRIVRPPTDFAIHWKVEKNNGTLSRTIRGAELALGGGWFMRGDQSWQLDRDAIPDSLRDLLNHSKLDGESVVRLVKDLIPYAAQRGIPLTTDAVIGTPSMLRFNLVKLLERSMDVQLIADKSLLASLRHIVNAPRHLMSKNVVFPDLGAIVGPELHQFIQGNIVRLTSDSVPRLVYYAQQLNTDDWGFDRAQLRDRYPLHDLSIFTPHWELKHVESRGIGHYEASVLLSSGANSIPRRNFENRIGVFGGFLKVKQGWIVVSSQGEAILRGIDTTFGHDFVLSTSELMGEPSARFERTGLPLPTVNPIEQSTDPVTTLNQLDALRGHGIPALLTGYPDFGTSLLMQICGRIFDLYPNSKILWVASAQQHGSIKTASKKLKVSANAFPRNAYYIEAGRIYFSDQFYDSMVVNYGSAWTLIIFENSVPLLSRSQFLKWDKIPRQWSIFACAAKFESLGSEEKGFALDLLELDRPLINLVQRYCVFQYTGSFSQITVGTGDAAPGIPVPPVPAIPLPRGSDKWTMPPGFGYRPAVITSPVESFVAQGKRLADKVETQADPVPFSKSHPTYADMTPDQQRWYFYWRGQARSGNWLSTELGYLFIYFYEMINIIGFDSPLAAYEQMIAAWKAFRTNHMKFDAELVKWIADFSAYHKLPETPLHWYGRALESGAQISDPILQFEAIRAVYNAAADRQHVLPRLLYLLADYDPDDSKFYQQENRDGSVDRAFVKSVAAVDSYLRRTQQRGLLDLPQKAKPNLIRRKPFHGVPNEYPDSIITIASLTADSDSLANLALQLQGIYKYTENKLRAQIKFKGKMRTADLPTEWEKPIDESLVVPKVVPILTFDPDRIKTLVAESSDVRAMLVVEDELPPDIVQPAQPESVQPESLVTETPLIPPIAPDYTTLDSHLQEFARGLQPVHWRILNALYTQTDSAAVLKREAQAAHTLPSLLIETINERALESIGDLIVDTMTNPPHILDDARDSVTTLITWASSQPALLT